MPENAKNPKIILEQRMLESAFQDERSIILKFRQEMTIHK